MAGILDTLKNPLASGQGQTQQPLIGQQERAQRITSAATGKAYGPSAAPARANLGEQIAKAETDSQLVAQQQQGQMQAQALQAQDEQSIAQAQLGQRVLDENTLAQQNDYLTKAGNIISDFTKQGAQLDLNKSKAKAEQAGFMLRLGNDKYINQLKSEGAKSRLQSKLAFDNALQRSIFADEEDLLRSDLEFRRMVNSDQREFEKQLAGMDLDMALRIASQESRAANQSAMWSGIGQVAKGGIMAASNSGGSESPGSADLNEGVTTEPASAVVSPNNNTGRIS